MQPDTTQNNKKHSKTVDNVNIDELTFDPTRFTSGFPSTKTTVSTFTNSINLYLSLENFGFDTGKKNSVSGVILCINSAKSDFLDAIPFPSII